MTSNQQNTFCHYRASSTDDYCRKPPSNKSLLKRSGDDGAESLRCSKHDSLCVATSTDMPVCSFAALPGSNYCSKHNYRQAVEWQKSYPSSRSVLDQATLDVLRQHGAPTQRQYYSPDSRYPLK